MNSGLKLQQPDLTKSQWREIAQRQAMGLAELQTIIAVLVEKLGGSVEVAGTEFQVPREVGYKKLEEVAPTLYDAHGQQVRAYTAGLLITSRRVTAPAQEEVVPESENDSEVHS